MPCTEFQNRLLAWFDLHGRKDLPWQVPNDPYRVWISEIMLQQTQVSTVIGYFERFIQRFPDLQSLEASSLESVLALWAGLGYYARARNLHRCAQILAKDWDKQFPKSQEALEKLPGIGRSTAGAILSLGFQKQAAILDGNVRRVLTRHFMISGWPGGPAAQRELWKISESLVPALRPGAFNQALMDLGSLICTPRRPRCNDCPMKTSCRAFGAGQQERFPERKPQSKKPVRFCYFLILRDQGSRIYLESRPESGIWGGLLSLPEFESLAALSRWLEERKISRVTMKELPKRRHTFTHFHLDFIPILSDSDTLIRERSLAPGQLLRPEEFQRLPAPIHELLCALTPQGSPPASSLKVDRNP